MFKLSSIPHMHGLKNQFIRMSTNNHVPGTQLFSGHNGSVALALALGVAQHMACDNPKEDSCGSCVSCKQFEHGNYPDIYFTFPYTKSSERAQNCSELTEQFLVAIKEEPYLTEQSWQSRLQSGNKQFIIPVSESERIISKLAVKPFSAKPRFFVLWLPEYLHQSAANKLLKSFEEPGENTYFFLISNHAERILGTIKSRCVSYMINRYNEAELTNILSEAYTSSWLDAAVLESEGSIGVALSLLADRQNHEQLSELFVSWMRLIYTRKMDGLLNWTEDASRLYREEVKVFLDFSSRLLRQASLQNLEASRYNFTFESFDLNKFRPYIDALKGNEILHLIENARADISRNGNPKIILLDLSLRLMKYIG